MQFYMLEWILFGHLCFASGYTWSYTNWFNQVLKQWGNVNNFKINPQINSEKHSCKISYLRGTNGTLVSPNYPKHYPNNANCTWIIETPLHYNEIHLELIKFNVENPKWSKICFKDYVEIYQYIHGKREKKGVYCGKRSGQNIAIYGHKTEIVFKSNGYRTKKGFDIKWQAIQGCGGTMSGKKGELILPPSDSVDKRFFCEWKIKASSTHNQIELYIDKLVYPRNYTSCKRGSLMVLNKLGETIGEYCHSQKRTSIRIFDNEAIIRIQIFKKTKQHEFKATWKSSIYQREERQCGIASVEHHRRRRLVGGTVVEQGASPWVVQVRTSIVGTNFRSRTVICGGVIISPFFVLTAAHCVVRKTKVLKYEILIGSTSEYITDQKILTLNEHQIHAHPNFNWQQNGKPEHDIALLRLPSLLQFTNTIQPICLPDKREQISNECSLSGWGKTSQNSRHSPQLNTIKAYKWGHCDNSQSVLCVSYHGNNNGACKGDSGSPITCKGSDKRHYVTGLLSYGAKTCPSSVDGYADVSYYLDWIYNTIKKYGNEIDNT